MKPAFALDFRNDAIALLHRTSGGWHQIGRVTFDEPDLASALGYLRSTALGLSPRGLATKLVLPDEQILYATVDAPGPDDASRAAQIRSALEGRTPYPVEDLIFDWEVVGGAVRVAVIARETLAEAEGFAAEHRFNPVCFVAAPDAGFDGEPWFGPTGHAASLLADGEAVERDGEQVQVIARAVAEDRAPEPAAKAAETAAETAPEPAAKAADPGPAAEPQMAPEMAPQNGHLSGEAAQSDAVSADFAGPEAELYDAPADFKAAPETVAETAPRTGAAPDVFDPDPVDAFGDDLQDGPPRLDDNDLPDLPPMPRDQSLFGLADDEPPPSQAFRTAPAKPKEPKAKERRGQDFWGVPQPMRPAVTIEPTAPAPRAEAETLRPLAPPSAALPADLVDDLPEDLSDALNDYPPEDAVRAEPRRAADAPAAEAPMALDVEEDDPTPAGPQDDFSADALGAADDVPPVPGYSPTMGFASRRASADPGTAPKLGTPPPRPTVARPTAARPIAPAAPKPERPVVDRPTAVNPTAPRENKGLRGLSAFVTAPGLPGSRKKKVAAPIAAPTAAPSGPQPEPAAVPAGKRAASLEKGIGASRTPVRGKPRYLGLILTALLLLTLAVIAAWSTSLAFRSDDSSETELASDPSAPDGAALPAPEDEMLADGQLPEAEVAPETAPPEQQAADQPAPDAVAETAPETPAEGETVALAGPGDQAGSMAEAEIVLAAKDPSPDLPEPLAQPEATAQGDPLPLAQAPPPPFGTVYQFDANGLIVPTPEGIVTPEGVRLVAGKPPRVPPQRPEGLAPAVPEATAAPDAAPDAAAALPLVADPALAGLRPKPRPEGLSAPIELNAAPTPSDNRLAGKRPLARPETVLAAGEAALAAKAASAASLAAPDAAADQTNAGQTSPFAVAISRRPEPRPRDLSRAVEAAVAAAMRAPEPTPDPEPQPEPQPEQTASLVPKKAPERSILKAPEPDPEPESKTAGKSAVKSAPRGKGDQPQTEADDEPETASAAPSGKTTGSVAKQATFKNALALDKTALIGVYGTPSKRYAMIRTSGGRYKKVKVGDSVDGGKIQAITASEVRYQKGSRLVTLALPRS